MSLIEHLLFLAFITLITALVTAAIRLDDPPRIFNEAQRFFLTIIVGMVILGGIICAIDWIFVHRLI